MALVGALLALGCGQGPLVLGSDIVWKSDFESGDLSAWTNDSAGGTYSISSDASLLVSSEHSHTGQYAVRIANTTEGTEGGGGLYREGGLPEEAYYSAWYYVPRQYKTTTGWMVMRFAARQDATTVFSTIGLVLYSRPGGDFELRLNDYRPEYLQAPLADPPPIVPMGRWFQLETLYRNVSDSSGRIVVWIDGVRRYDIGRPMDAVPKLYFAVCGHTNVLEPSDAELFIDDVVISYQRVTPRGLLEASP